MPLSDFSCIRSAANRSKQADKVNNVIEYVLLCFDGELLESRFEQLQLPNYFFNDWQPDDQITLEWNLFFGI